MDVLQGMLSMWITKFRDGCRKGVLVRLRRTIDLLPSEHLIEPSAREARAMSLPLFQEHLIENNTMTGCVEHLERAGARVSTRGRGGCESRRLDYICINDDALAQRFLSSLSVPSFFIAAVA